MISSIARVLANISPIIIVVLFSKFASVEQLGELNYFIALITIIGVFSDFGIPEALQTFLPKQKGAKSIMPYLLLELALVSITALGLYLLDTLTTGQISRDNLTILICLTLASSSNSVLIAFNGLLQRVRAGMYYLGSSVLLFAVTFGAYFYGSMSPLESFLWGRLVSWMVFLVIPLADLYVQGKLEWKLGVPLAQLRFTFNNFLVRALYTLTFQWDSLLVNFFSGAYVTGFFRTVALAASTPLVISTFISTKLLPEYSLWVHEQRFNYVRAHYRNMTAVVAVLGVIAVLLSIPLANPGLRALFNSEIADAGAGYFILLFLAAWLYVLAVPALTVLQAMTKDVVLVATSIVQAGIFTVLSTVLYPDHGLGIVPVLLIGANAIFALILNAYAYYCLSAAPSAKRNR